MKKNPKCVFILTEGPSDREAFTGFFTELYALIDPDIEVFFPVLCDDYIQDIEKKYNGDITSRDHINPDNILPMLLKMFIHPEIRKHSAYQYPKSVCEVVHLVDIDGVYLNNDRIIQVDGNLGESNVFYDVEANIMKVKSKRVIKDRNLRKRANLEKLVHTRRLRISMEKDKSEYKEKPYRVFYFSSNLDHVLHDKANNRRGDKVKDARKIANQFYEDPLKMASYLLKHPCSVTTDNYLESWECVMNDKTSLSPRTNINLLIKDLLKRANIDYRQIP